MSDLSELLKRVESAIGPDEALDLDLARALAPNVICLRFNEETQQNEPFVHWEYTASIDAALALVERCLPGWTIAHLSQRDDKSWFCELREGYLTSYNRVAMSPTEYAAPRLTLPLAILAALLRALATERTGR